jgi:hypothetical protein
LGAERINALGILAGETKGSREAEAAKVVFEVKQMR